VTQPTFTEVREALAAQLATIPGLRTTTEQADQVNPPVAVIMPVSGTFIRYGATFDDNADITLRAILLAAKTDTSGGQDLMDTYLAVTGDSSINAAIQADPTLGGIVQSASLAEATGYGLISWNNIEYLGCQMIVEIGI
jgi:hypothetical protein